jgi:hypothetical protein
MLLGVFYLLSGFNWFFGYMPPLPSIDMPLDTELKHPVVMEMIRTGWMFQFAKVAEIAAGIALVTNRFVPMMLAATAPLAFITFMLDALILDDIWGWLTGSVSTPAVLAAIGDMVIGGLCVLLIQLWLILAYRDYFRPLLSFRAIPSEFAAPAAGTEPSGTGQPNLAKKAFIGLGCLAILLQAWNFYLFVGLIGS